MKTYTINKSLLNNPAFCQETKESIKTLTKGRFFTVHFIKANGKPRRITGRLGVKKYFRTLNGVGNTAPDKPNRLTIWDSASKGHRTIPIDRLTGLVIAGKRYKFQ